jgi:hypothetical protein
MNLDANGIHSNSDFLMALMPKENKNDILSSLGNPTLFLLPLAAMDLFKEQATSQADIHFVDYPSLLIHKPTVEEITNKLFDFQSSKSHLILKTLKARKPRSGNEIKFTFDRGSMEITG